MGKEDPLKDKTILKDPGRDMRGKRKRDDTIIQTPSYRVGDEAEGLMQYWNITYSRVINLLPFHLSGTGH